MFLFECDKFEIILIFVLVLRVTKLEIILILVLVLRGMKFEIILILVLVLRVTKFVIISILVLVLRVTKFKIILILVLVFRVTKFKINWDSNTENSENVPPKLNQVNKIEILTLKKEKSIISKKTIFCFFQFFSFSPFILS